jgi:hypothetical protein
MYNIFAWSLVLFIAYAISEGIEGIKDTFKCKCNTHNCVNQ